MTGYLVFACSRCGSVRYAREGQKSATCVRCGYQIRLDQRKTRILLKAERRQEAIEAVKRYKMMLGSRGSL